MRYKSILAIGDSLTAEYKGSSYVWYLIDLLKKSGVKSVVGYLPISIYDRHLAEKDLVSVDISRRFFQMVGRSDFLFGEGVFKFSPDGKGCFRPEAAVGEPEGLNNPTQPNSTQLNPTQPNSTQLNPTQPNSTQLNPTQPNSTQPNPTQLNSTQLNSTQLNSTQLNPILEFASRKT